MDNDRNLLERITALEKENEQLKATAAEAETAAQAYQESQMMFQTVFQS